MTDQDQDIGTSRAPVLSVSLTHLRNHDSNMITQARFASQSPDRDSVSSNLTDPNRHSPLAGSTLPRKPSLFQDDILAVTSPTTSPTTSRIASITPPAILPLDWEKTHTSEPFVQDRTSIDYIATRGVATALHTVKPATWTVHLTRTAAPSPQGWSWSSRKTSVSVTPTLSWGLTIKHRTRNSSSVGAATAGTSVVIVAEVTVDSIAAQCGVIASGDQILQINILVLDKSSNVTHAQV